MKKWIQRIFTGLILAMCLTMSVGMLFAGEQTASANEQLAAAPSIRTAQGGPNPFVLSDCADWFADRFFPRKALIRADNALTAALFGQSREDDVICGADGWLYYAPTLADFTGTDPMSARERFSVVRNVTLMAEYCESAGRQFVFCIAPNKNSVYPEYMPNYGAIAQTRDAQAVMQALAGAGVVCADLFTPLTAQKQQGLYYAHDTHWNSRGAALGADTIARAFDIESSYFAGDFSETQRHDGDLYAMLYPDAVDNETEAVYAAELPYRYTGAATNPSSVTLQTVGAGETSLLAYRDSFGTLLHPYLAALFGESYFSRASVYDLTREGDCVLIEIVERNLRSLIKYMPLMPAPERSLDFGEADGSVRIEALSGSAPEGTRGYRGTLPDDADADSGVYLVCGERAYEAFCLSDNGFAAYIDEAETVTGVAYCVGGTTVLRTAA